MNKCPYTKLARFDDCGTALTIYKLYANALTQTHPYAMSHNQRDLRLPCLCMVYFKPRSICFMRNPDQSEIVLHCTK